MTLWIRRSVVDNVLAAARLTDRSTHVFYFTGEGGIGKTIALRELGSELGSPDGMVKAHGWSGILDLHHSDVNSNSRLETRLREAVGQVSDFRTYLEEREAFDERRKAGMLGSPLEKELDSLARYYSEDFNRLTKGQRLVVAFDTTERLRFQDDGVQRLCGLKDKSASVLPWLLNQVERWQNTVVVLAGRPDEGYLDAALRERFGDKSHVIYHPEVLEKFSEADALKLLSQHTSDTPELSALTLDQWQQMAELAGYRPLRLEFMLELLRTHIGWDELETRLQALPRDSVGDEIDRALLDALVKARRDPFEQEVFRYLTIARKGLNAELLHHLDPALPPDECRIRLEEMAARPYIKRRPDDDRLYLHDALFEVCDHPAILKIDEAQEISGEILNWYQKRLDGAPDENRDWAVDSLFYRLRANPRAGYGWYARQLDPAIRALEIGFDMRLRNELLAFLGSASRIDRALLHRDASLHREINCDEAARWVRRLTVRGQIKQARDLAAFAANDDRLCGCTDELSSLACADLAVHWGLAEIYLSDQKRAIPRIKAAVAMLEGVKPPETVAAEDPKSDYGWRRNGVLGRAHNYLGYAYWKQGRYTLAIEEFRKALPYFRASGHLEEDANTSDNMGRVYALLYLEAEARVKLDDSLKVRRSLQLRYREGLSLVSHMLFHLQFDRPSRTLAIEKQVMPIFDELDADRGRGLVYLATGQAKRRQAAMAVEDVVGSLSDAKALCRSARDDLEKAQKIFSSTVNEPAHFVECLNELGCTWRTFALLEETEAKASPAGSNKAALELLENAIREAKTRALFSHAVDSCEDIAQVYYQRRSYGMADYWLAEAQKYIPTKYVMIPRAGFPVVNEEDRIDEFYHLLGKIELLRGKIAYARSERDAAGHVPMAIVQEALEHYLLGMAYFEKFSPGSTRVAVIQAAVYDLLKERKLNEIKELEEELPRIASDYDLELNTLTGFLKRTLGVQLPAA